MGFPPGTTETVSRVTSRCLDCLYLLTSAFKSLSFGIVYGVCHLYRVVDKNLFSTCSVSVLSLSWYTFEVNVLTLLNISFYRKSCRTSHCLRFLRTSTIQSLEQATKVSFFFTSETDKHRSMAGSNRIQYQQLLKQLASILSKGTLCQHPANMSARFIGF